MVGTMGGTAAKANLQQQRQELERKERQLKQEQQKLEHDRKMVRRLPSMVAVLLAV